MSEALCLPANLGAIKVVVLVQSIDVGALQPVSSCKMGDTGVERREPSRRHGLDVSLDASSACASREACADAALQMHHVKRGVCRCACEHDVKQNL